MFVFSCVWFSPPTIFWLTLPRATPTRRTVSILKTFAVKALEEITRYHFWHSIEYSQNCICPSFVKLGKSYMGRMLGLLKNWNTVTIWIPNTWIPDSIGVRYSGLETKGRQFTKFESLLFNTLQNIVAHSGDLKPGHVPISNGWKVGALHMVKIFMESQIRKSKPFENRPKWPPYCFKYIKSGLLVQITNGLVFRWLPLPFENQNIEIRPYTVGKDC